MLNQNNGIITNEHLNLKIEFDFDIRFSFSDVKIEFKLNFDQCEYSSHVRTLFNHRWVWFYFWLLDNRDQVFDRIKWSADKNNQIFRDETCSRTGKMGCSGEQGLTQNDVGLNILYSHRIIDLKSMIMFETNEISQYSWNSQKRKVKIEQEKQSIKKRFRRLRNSDF